MKRFMYLTALAVVMTTMVACDKNKNNSPDAPIDPVIPEKGYYVGLWESQTLTDTLHISPDFLDLLGEMGTTIKTMLTYGYGPNADLAYIPTTSLMTDLRSDSTCEISVHLKTALYAHGVKPFTSVEVYEPLPLPLPYLTMDTVLTTEAQYAMSAAELKIWVSNDTITMDVEKVSDTEMNWTMSEQMTDLLQEQISDIMGSIGSLFGGQLDEWIDKIVFKMTKKA